MLINEELRALGKTPETSRDHDSPPTKRASASIDRRPPLTIRPGTADPLHPVHGGQCRSSLAPSPPKDYGTNCSRRTAHRQAERPRSCCVEDKQFTKDLPRPRALDSHAPHRGIHRRKKKIRKIVVEYPIGHRRRARNGMPLLVETFQDQPRAPRPSPEKQRPRPIPGPLAMDAKALRSHRRA